MLWARSSVSTSSGRLPSRRTRRPSGTSASAVSAVSSPTCASRCPVPRSRATRSACSPARAPSCRQPSATTPTPRSPDPARDACRGTRGGTATRSCARSSTRSAAASAATTACSWTRTSTSTARPPRAPASGFYGKNTLLITRRHGSWVVLGTLVTTAELEPTPPLELDCGSCRLCIDACPTGALDEPGTLDATRCLSYWTQTANDVPEPYREALGASVYGCDICQDVCPWNRGVEKRRAGAPLPSGAEANVSLVDWLEADADELASDYAGCSCRRNDGRYLQRNALVGARERRARRASSRSPNATLDRRRPALARVRGVGLRAARRTRRHRVSRRSAARRPSAGSPGCGSAPSPSRSSQVVLLGDDYPNGRYEAVRLADHRAFSRVGALVFLVAQPADLLGPVAAVARLHRARLRRRDRRRLRTRVYSFEQRHADPPGCVHPDRGGGAPLRHPRRRSCLSLSYLPVHARSSSSASDRFDHPFDFDNVIFPVGVLLITGLIVGWLVQRLRRQIGARRAARARRRRQLRDELGRRADLLDAANRCARALSSSLDIEQAFAAFIRELRGLVPFDRTAIVLAEDDLARVIATAGVGAETVFPPGSERPVAGTVLRGASSAPVSPSTGEDMADRAHPEEDELRRARPALARGRAAARRARSRSGCSRSSAASRTSFDEQEIELVDAARAARSAPRCRTSGRTRPSGRPWRSCGDSRRSAPTSSRSSRTSCAARWRRVIGVGADAPRALARAARPSSASRSSALIAHETDAARRAGRRTCSTPRGSRPGRSATRSTTSTSARSCATAAAAAESGQDEVAGARRGRRRRCRLSAATPSACARCSRT